MKNFLKENWFLVLTVLYVLSPIDIIPDQIPLIGQTDDAMLVFVELIRKYSEYKKGQNNLEEKTNE